MFEPARAFASPLEAMFLDLSPLRRHRDFRYVSVPILPAFWRYRRAETALGTEVA